MGGFSADTLMAALEFSEKTRIPITAVVQFIIDNTERSAEERLEEKSTKSTVMIRRLEAKALERNWLIEGTPFEPPHRVLLAYQNTD